MAQTRDLAAAYGQLLGLLVETPQLESFLDRVVRLAAEVIVPAAACGVTLDNDGHPFTVAASDTLASQVDEIQYGANEGPCLDSLRSGEPVQVDDLPGDRRWPSYRPHAVAEGVLSSLSLPLHVDGRTVGALNLYGSRRAAFGSAERRDAEAFAARCASALILALRQGRQLEVNHQLGEAIASRSVIDQAIGILMAQQRCSAGVAFDLLRTASQNRNRKLREIAADLVTDVAGQPPQPPAGFRVPAPSPGRSRR